MGGDRYNQSHDATSAGSALPTPQRLKRTGIRQTGIDCKDPAGVMAVVVTYQPDPDELECTLQSLIHQADGIALIDNTPGQANDKVSKVISNLRRIYSGQFHWKKNDKNLGIGAAQNRGIKIAIKNGFRFVLLSDQDTVYQPDTVGQLAAAYFAQRSLGKAVAAVAPGYLHSDRPSQKHVVFIQHDSLLERRIHAHHGVHRISYAIASGCLIPTKTFERAGLMDETLFMDWTDIEWCLRACSHGMEISGCADTRIIHHLGDGTGRIFGKAISLHSPLRHYYIARNALALALYYSTPTTLQRIRFGISAIAYCCLIPWICSQPFKHVKMTLIGLAHGLINRKGPLTEE